MKRFLILFTLSFLLTSIQSLGQENSQTLKFSGIASIEQVGSCRMIQKPYNVRLILIFSQNSSKFIAKEYAKTVSGPFEEQNDRKWTGEALNKKAIRFEVDSKFICSGKSRTETLHFIGIINCEDGICKMLLEDTYAMCPAGNCIFKIKYDLILLEN